MTLEILKEASNVATKLAYDKSILIVIRHFNSSRSLAGKPIYKRGGVVPTFSGLHQREGVRREPFDVEKSVPGRFSGTVSRKLLCKEIGV